MRRTTGVKEGELGAAMQGIETLDTRQCVETASLQEFAVVLVGSAAGSRTNTVLFAI
jgi:hypothetical protein